MYQINHGVIVPFVKKFYKQMIIVVVALFITSMASMTLNANAAPTTFNFTQPELDANWGPERIAPTGGYSSVSSVFGRNDVASININSSLAYSNPGDLNTQRYYNTEGIKTPKNVADNFSNGGNFGLSVEVDLYLDPAWDNTAVRAGLWTVGDNGSGGTNPGSYPFGIVEFANVSGYEGFRYWNPSVGYVQVSGFTGYGQWVTLKITLDPTTDQYQYAIKGNSVGSSTSPAVSTYLHSVILNQFNFGLYPQSGLNSNSYTVHWDGVLPPDTTPPANLLSTYKERPSGDPVANGGATDSEMFTFNLSATGDPVRYQLKYWNDIVGSPYKIGSPWNPSDLAGYSPVLGTYNDQFTQGEGKHYFSFSACDAANNCSAFSDPFVVTYDVTDPSVPVHLSPTDGSFKTTATQTLIDWQDVTDPSNPVKYLYQSSNNPATSGPEGAFVSPAYNSGVLGSSQIATPGTPQGVWYWHVRAVDAAGNMSNWSNAWMVTIDNNAPAIPSPITMKENDGELSNLTNGGYTNSYSVTTSWGHVADSNYYEYSYWNDIPANPYKEGSRYIATPVNSTSLSGVFNQGQGVHHVAVRAVDASGNKSAWSTTFTITYDSTLPSVPTLLTPTNSSTLGTNVFSFTWNASTDASPVKYEFQSSLSSSQSIGVLNSGVWNNIANGNASQNNLTTPEIPSVGAPDGTWYWQVRAIDAAGNVSAWSAIWNVTLDTAEDVTETPGGGTLLDENDVLGVFTEVPNNIGEEKNTPSTDVLAVTTGGQGQGGVVLADTDTLATTGQPSYLYVIAGLVLAGTASGLLVLNRKK